MRASVEQLPAAVRDIADLIIEPPDDPHPWRPVRRPPAPSPASGRTSPDNDRPRPHWIRSAALATALAAVVGYGFVAIVGRGAHSAPRPHFATGATGAGLSVPVAGGARLGVAVRQAVPGVVVSSVVAGSAAEHADLRVADVLQTVDGVTVTSPAQLSAIVHLHRVGDALHIEILRNAHRITVIATLGPA